MTAPTELRRDLRHVHLGWQAAHADAPTTVHFIHDERGAAAFRSGQKVHQTLRLSGSGLTIFEIALANFSPDQRPSPVDTSEQVLPPTQILLVQSFSLSQCRPGAPSEHT